MLNEALFRETIKALRTEGALRRNFNMDNWINECNTAGCIAGTVALLCGQKSINLASTLLTNYYSIPGFAEEKLGLHSRMADHLFTPSDWWSDLEMGIFKSHIIPTPNNPYPSDAHIEEMCEWADRTMINTSGVVCNDHYERAPITPDYAALVLEHILERHPNYVDWMTPYQEMINA